MFKRAKILALPLVLVMILAVPALAGCGGKVVETGTTGGLTAQELQQVLSDSMLAVKNATSYGFSLDMSMNAEAIGGTQAGKMGMTMGADGVADLANMAMRFGLDMSVTQDIPGEDNTPQSISAEVYMLDNVMYMKMDVPGAGEQWIKTPVTENVTQSYDLDMVNQELTPLETATQIEFVKYETVDGSKCYVLTVAPDIASIKEWLAQQEMTSGAMDWNSLTQEAFKELSYTVWIAQDTKLMKKLNMAMLLEMTAEQAGSNASDFDKMTLDLNMNMLMKHYNESVSIVLPDEAQNATEM